MGHMKPSLKAAAAAAVGLLAVLAPSAASAKIAELGATTTKLVAPPPCTTKGSALPVCPNGISAANYAILLTTVTALETIADGNAYPTTVKQAGRIVAFTVGLSALDTNTKTRRSEIHQADVNHGGTAQVAVAVLRRVGAARARKWKVVAESPSYHVQPYLGLVVQLPLTTTLPVRRGDVVALTTPTWAPILSIGHSSKTFAYRQSRRANCASAPASNQAQLTINSTVGYVCNYPGTRVEYSATEVTETAYPKNYVHAPDIVARAAARVLGLKPSGGATPAN
jgi:hypothetical protein